MFFTLKLPRRTLALLLAVPAALALLLAVLLHRGGSDGILLRDGDTRVGYLRSLGWEVADEPLEQLSVTLPEPLTEPYLAFNTLQLRQGLDLAPYAGQTLLRCSYAAADGDDADADVRIDLYLTQDGRLVAAAVIRTGARGSIHPLLSSE